MEDLSEAIRENARQDVWRPVAWNSPDRTLSLVIGSSALKKPRRAFSIAKAASVL